MAVNPGNTDSLNPYTFFQVRIGILQDFSL